MPDPVRSRRKVPFGERALRSHLNVAVFDWHRSPSDTESDGALSRHHVRRRRLYERHGIGKVVVPLAIIEGAEHDWGAGFHTRRVAVDTRDDATHEGRSLRRPRDREQTGHLSMHDDVRRAALELPLSRDRAILMANGVEAEGSQLAADREIAVAGGGLRPAVGSRSRERGLDLREVLVADDRKHLQLVAVRPSGREIAPRTSSGGDGSESTDERRR